MRRNSSLSIGVDGNGTGPARTHRTGVFIPRNAPPLFNLGAMTRLFWDGRVELIAHGRFKTPAGTQLTPAMEHVFQFGASTPDVMAERLASLW